MEEKKKDLIREALNDDLLADVTGGNTQGYDGEGEFLECPQCHHWVLCTEKCPMEKHMKNFCDAR